MDQEKRKKNQNTRIRGESGDITINITETKRIIKESLNNCIPINEIY